METIGFIGLGKMGWWMARNIIKAGYSLIAYDMDKSIVNQLVERGAHAGKTPKEVAMISDFVLLMVPPPAVEEVLFSDQGVLGGCLSNQIIVNCANSNPEDDKRFAEKCWEKGIHYLDVGSSGSPKGAKDGTLAFMAGGYFPAYERIEKVLRCMGSAVEYFGPVGSGHLVKIVNNITLIMNMVCVSEAIHFAKRCGLEAEDVLRIMNHGAARSWVLEQALAYYEKDPNDRKTDQFEIPRNGKGNHINWAQELAREKGVLLPMAALANEFFTCATDGMDTTDYEDTINVLRGIRWQMAVASAGKKD